MIKASLLAMGVLTVLIATGLRWREQRMAGVRPAMKIGMVARGKRTIDRWVTAAAVAAAATMIVLGGLHWIRLWVG